jgi:magnesium-transporting ATPase (P-type)
MLCCHSLFLSKGKLSGPEIEKQLFEHIGATIEPNDSTIYHSTVRRGKYVFGIVRTYEFTSDTQRMSVVAVDLATQQKHVFVKGANELLL